jgi:hypothetical protein
MNPGPKRIRISILSYTSRVPLKYMNGNKRLVEVYLKKSQKGGSESVQNMVDFTIQFIGSEQRPPPLENRMGNL